jgi:hypothetical protein
VPPLEICFLTARVGADRMLILVTHADFPYRAPVARVAPFVQMQPDDDMYDVFAKAWDQSDAIAYQPEWTAETTLLEYVHALEAHLGLTKSESTESSEETL